MKRRHDPEAEARAGEFAAPGDALFQAFAAAASDAILVIDEDSVIHFANSAAEKVFGYDPQELRGESLTRLMPEYLRHLHRAGVTRYLETGVRHADWSGVELPGLHREGRELELEISFGEFARGGRRFFAGVARDISERKRADRRLAVRHAAARAMADAQSVAQLAGGILRAVGENLNWEAGSYWEADRAAGVLRCVETWQRSPGELTEFAEGTRARAFRRGEGLPGRVWETGRAAWIADVQDDANFARAGLAARAGVRAGFGFPVRLGADVVGVMEFFCEDVRPPDAELEALVSSLGSQLGQFVERERAASALRAAEESQRFLAEAGQLLAASLDYETTLQSTAQLVVPYLADWCVIDLLAPGGRIERVAVAHQEPARVEWVREATRRSPVNPRAGEGVARVVREGRAQLFAEITDEILSAVYPEPEKLALVRRLGLRSAMIVPLVAGDRAFGAISFATAESARRYTATDLALAGDLAHRAAVAIENARLYREAQEVNRLKDEFLATLSHELRTPLTAILGWTGLLRTVKLDEATAAGALETIERNAQAQKQLIDDLLDASRIISGKLRLEARLVPLAEVVAAAVESAQPAAAAKGVRLQFPGSGADAAGRPEGAAGRRGDRAGERESAKGEGGRSAGGGNSTRDDSPGDTPPHAPAPSRESAIIVTGDAGRLQQVVWNLLSNAIKFTPKGGSVEVNLARAGDEAEIAVSDTGQGIAPEFLPHIFDRFRQADSSTTRAHGGLGLGLSIVRHLVELHGGSVAVESAGAGRGTTFRVRLPVAQLPTAAQAAAAQAGGDAETQARVRPGARLAGLRVLVVEDDPDTLFMLGKTLERYGARVTGCESAAAARAALAGGDFDLLVSDIGMPVEDGYMLARRLRAAEDERGARRLPAIALTAYARPEDAAAAAAAGFDTHLAKPVSPAELVEAAAALTGRERP